MRAVFACNAYVDAQAPWALRKTDPERMAAVLGTLVAAVRELDAARSRRSSRTPPTSCWPLIDAGEGGRADRRSRTPLFPRLELGGGGGGGVRLIDSHCHLNYEGLVERQDEVLDNARAARRRAASSTSRRARREWGDVIAAAERNADVWASVGVHPHEADAHPDLGAAALVEAAEHPRVIAIGECGLDYYYDKSDRAAQRERFEAHIEAARQTGLPLVVHTRDAEDDTAEILGRAVQGRGRHRRPPLLHRLGRACAQGRSTSASTSRCRASSRSRTPQDLQETAKWLPADQMLVETDSPFLAPVPHRGQTCEPAFVADTAAFVAELRGEDARSSWPRRPPPTSSGCSAKAAA